MRSTALHGRFPIRLLAEPAIPLYTNLDSETFLIGTIKELYRLRWGIETSFREFKYTIGLSCLHGKKTDFLLQEVLKMLYTQTVLAFARKTTAGSTEIANQSSDRKTKQPRLANKYYSSCWSASSSTAFTLPVCTETVSSFFPRKLSPRSLNIKILLAIAFRTPDEKDSLQLRRFVIFLRPSQSWVNILRQLRLTLDITIVGNLPASKSNFAFDILSILIGNGQP